jgi:hypothetical protein
MSKLSFRRACISALLFLSGFAAFAQLPGSDGSPGVSTVMLKLFGNVTNFTARADVQVIDKANTEQLRTPMLFARLDSKLRVEIDMTQMRGKELAAASVAGLKQLGLDRVVSLLRVDRKALFIVYPNAQSYVAMPLPKEESEASIRNLKITKNALAQETVDGHPCVKNNVIIKDGTNLVLTATTWNATDLRDFPIQIATKENDNTSIMRFQQIQFVRPEPKQFDPPANFKQYHDPQTLVISRSTKVSTGAKK